MRNRETLKTVGGIVIIALIVIATFLYGNRQRQEQVRRDQDIKRQQEQAAEDNKQQVTVNPSADNQKVVVGDDKAATPNPTPNPATATGNTKTPETGGGLVVLLPVAALGLSYELARGSRRRLKTAVLAIAVR